MNTTTITNEMLLDALRCVIDPITGADIIASNRVSALTLRGSQVGFMLTIDPARKQAYTGIEKACERALIALDGIESVRVLMTAHNNEPLAPTALHPEPRERAHHNLTKLHGVDRIIAIASGKGGVGKSSVTIMLAHALTAAGHRVGICDADIYGPSIPRMLGLENKQPAIRDGKMLPAIAHGIMANSMGLITGDAAAILRGPMISKSLNQLLRGTYWTSEESRVESRECSESKTSLRGRESDEAIQPHSLDSRLSTLATPSTTLLIDLPPGTGDVQLSMAQQLPIDGAIIVTTPQAVSTIDAQKAAQMFEKLNIPILGIVENMSHFIAPDGSTHALFGTGGGAALATQFSVPLLASLPLDPAIGIALDNGQNPFSAHPQSECVKAFTILANILP